jgi:hypothetical protein
MEQYEVSEVNCLNGLGHSFGGQYWSLLQGFSFGATTPIWALAYLYENLRY